jgi:hypothetical protein
MIRQKHTISYDVVAVKRKLKKSLHLSQRDQRFFVNNNFVSVIVVFVFSLIEFKYD